jgi:secreted trypsin-like serine protease
MHKRQIAFLSILSLFLSLSLTPVNAIYGGEIALGDQRVAALVMNLNNEINSGCTAALLSPQIAVSAAHCINHGQILKSTDPLISPFVPTLPYWITVPGVATTDDDINTRVKVVRGFAAENYPFSTENSDIVFWVLEKPLVSKYSMNVATEKEVNELIALSGQMTHLGYGLQKHQDEPNNRDGKPYKIQGTVTSIKSTVDGSRAKEKELTETVPATVVTAPASSNFKIWISDPRNPKVGLATGIFITQKASPGAEKWEFKKANSDGTLYLTLADNSWSFDVLEPDGSENYQRRRYEMVIRNNIATIENAKADSRGIYAVTSKLVRVDTNIVIWQTNTIQTACPGDSGGPVYANFNSEEKIFAVQFGPYGGGGGCDTKPWPDGHIFKSTSTLIYPYIDLLRAEPLAASIVQAYDAAVSKEPGFDAKAAADLLVKQKAAADKAAADKAADKAIALASPKTITCVKGKLTKKVNAVKPVCPTGYKKK